MNILFWVSNFPVYSETFIRNQITELLDRGVNVNIYANSLNKNQLHTLDQYESYKLLERLQIKKNIFPNSKLKRVVKAIIALCRGLLSGNLKYYFRALKTSKYGYKAKSLKLLLFIDFLIKKKIDIVHAHFGPNGNDVVVYKEIGLPIKLICTFHGYDIRLGKKEGINFYSKLFKYADYIVSISEYNSSQLLAFGLDNSKLVRVNNGVTLSKSKPKETNSNNFINILSVGRLVKDKAFSSALESLHLYKKELPHVNWIYNIIGDGPLEAELKSLTLKLGIEKQVVFHLYQSSNFVENFMQKADFLLLSSINEALPTVILEAMALQLPVLATNVGGISELISDNENGVLVEPNTEALLLGINKIITKQKSWKSFGARSKAIIEANYDKDKEILKLIKLYKSCLDEAKLNFYNNTTIQ